MRGTLTYIEVDNFKSYKGFSRIGPFRPFTAVIGPNGAGKSNFMDAISFVMGEKTSSLRVKRLSDLIHGASVGRPVSRTATVTAILRLEDGVEKKFSRTVHGSTSEYRIDGNIVSQLDYSNQLEQLGINVKAKNFLVFQGAVENIALKSPKELTVLFEEVSGSGALKEEYERAKVEMLKAEDETQLTYMKKKGITAERKEAKLEKDEADKYQRLKDEYRDLEIRLDLFKLYCTEEEIQRLEEEIKAKRDEAEKLQSKKDKMHQELTKSKDELAKLTSKLAKKESRQREKERDLNAQKPAFIKAKENVLHLTKKWDSSKKSLEQAQKARAAHQKDIKDLRLQYKAVEQREEEYLESTAAASQSQGDDITLDDQQLRKYWKLKSSAQEKSATQLNRLNETKRSQKDDQEVLDSYTRQKNDQESRLKQITLEMTEATERLEKLSEHIRQSEISVGEQRRIRTELIAQASASKDKISNYQKKLDNVNGKLSDARIDKHEEARRRKKAEIVETFKSNFVGVYDRMINLCQPRHPKYNVPVTKVMGNYMEAIVVDTEKTARACIQYLKDQMLEPESFLPLDSIKFNPIRERLRDIQDPPNVHLLYDILDFKPKEIQRAVLFCTNNALVCVTQEDANRVAYDLDPVQRNDAVAYDGTFFRKSGIMSGGTRDLLKKAQRWDDKLVSKLKQEKDRITEELREAMKQSRKESELPAVEQQIIGLATRLKYAKGDKESTMKQITKLKKDQEGVRKELDEVNEKMKEIEERISQREKVIQSVKTELNKIEDNCFRSFCKQIGVPNIRRYEERELRSLQERQQKMVEFQNQKEQIKSQIDFEQSRVEGVESNVNRWEKAVEEAEEALQSKQSEEQKAKEDVERLMELFETIKKETSELKQELDKKNEEIAKARKEVGAAVKEMQAAQRVVVQMEARLDTKRSDKHDILKQCKIHGIRIPFQRGPLDDVEADANVDVDSSAGSEAIYEREKEMKVDYASLPEEYKGLSEEEIKRVTDQLNHKLRDLHSNLQKFQAPNMRADQKLETAKEKLLETNEEFDNVRRRVKSAKEAFEKVKNERHGKFMECFEHVASHIDPIYKVLTQNQSAQAMLGPENPEEPYLDGISYSCVAPGKRFQSMGSLSGGEKTVAALALLFAIHSYQAAPFFVLDEIDAALDNTNIGKVANYIRQKTSSRNVMQVVVISLKEEFYSHADALIGITPDVEPGDCLVSKMYSLDLSSYC